HVAQPSMHHGTPRAQRHAPKRKVETFDCQRALHEVMFPDRGTTRGDQDIGAPLAGTPNSSNNVLDAIAGNAEVIHIRALAACQCGEGKAVGINDLTRPRLAAGRNKFVTGPEYGDFWLTVNAEARMVHGGGKHQVALGQPASFMQQDLVVGEVDSL